MGKYGRRKVASKTGMKGGKALNTQERIVKILEGQLTGNFFEQALINTILLADSTNRQLLALVYPEYVKAINEWQGVK